MHRHVYRTERALIADIESVTSMLVTDVGYKMCWWQLYDIGDGFGHQHPLSFYIGVGSLNKKDVTKIEILPLVLAPNSSHQHQFFEEFSKTHPIEVFEDFNQRHCLRLFSIDLNLFGGDQKMIYLKQVNS